MHDSGETSVPLRGQESTPAANWNKHVNFFDEVTCSPCVNNACAKLAAETTGPISSDLFFTFLVSTSCGPTVTQWKNDGYNPERIISIFSASESE
mmetsp:Transcript_15197/g.19268  ORF Transcript_15197/g.19268 Transcript_15197/m.19268 type:complete len:95 (+) Transcript_15197:190-474(+)